MLYKIEKAVRSGITEKVCTDVPCTWNQNFTKNVSAAKVQQIKFYTDEAKSKLVAQTKSKEVIPTFSQKENFLMKISENNVKVVGLSLFSNFQESFVPTQTVQPVKLPPSLRDLYRKELCNASHDVLNEECQKILESFSVDIEQLAYVEESTRNQNKSATWYNQRIGRITGSIAHQALSTPPSQSLIKRICQSQCHTINSPALKWGRDHESEALKCYVSAMSLDTTECKPKLIGNLKKHGSFECLDIGLVIDKEYQCLGASPDAVFHCTCCDYGVVEIKCPYSLRESSLSQAIRDNRNFYIELKNDCYNLKRNHPYFTQVQMEMRATETKVCNFVVWTPLELLILKIMEDKQFQEEICIKLFNNWKNYILPELVTRRLQQPSGKETGINQVALHSLKKTYCLCKTIVAEGNMVGCDMCDDWFHPSCVKLTKLPNSKVWYCPDCRKLKKQKLDN